MRVIDEVARGAGSIGLREAPAQPEQGWSWTNVWRRFHTSRELRHLSDEALADIGLTRAEANREACLPLWKMF
ncbi:DUF1127 domain-containing protein [Pseudomonas sp. AA-38]|uniref:DUF1127 domain-containing protein n=1 Tax=Pseudomonas sp. AA-38 TaxID=3028807 RepID=UPI0023F6BAD9|nr:DUF1127 domain-containing protein [Pseudomonas sp. AA-38]